MMLCENKVQKDLHVAMAPVVRTGFPLGAVPRTNSQNRHLSRLTIVDFAF